MSSPNTRQEVGNPVLPCSDLDVEVVSDVIEELADIEVVAEPKEEPDPDILVSATVTDDPPGSSSNAAQGEGEKPEPDYDVEVAFKVDDAAEPDITVTCSISNDSNEPIEERANG